MDITVNICQPKNTSEESHLALRRLDASALVNLPFRSAHVRAERQTCPSISATSSAAASRVSTRCSPLPASAQARSILQRLFDVLLGRGQIDARDSQVAVTEDGLDLRKVGICFEQATGEAVPKGMRGDDV